MKPSYLLILLIFHKINHCCEKSKQHKEFYFWPVYWVRASNTSAGFSPTKVCTFRVDAAPAVVRTEIKLDGLDTISRAPVASNSTPCAFPDWRMHRMNGRPAVFFLRLWYMVTALAPPRCKEPRDEAPAPSFYISISSTEKNIFAYLTKSHAIFIINIWVHYIT